MRFTRNLISILLVALSVAACQEERKPNALMADALDALLELDPTLAPVSGKFDASELVAAPVGYMLPEDALMTLLDSREKNKDGILLPTTQFIMDDLGEDKAQIFAKLRLLNHLPLYLPQELVVQLKKTDLVAAERLNNNNAVNFEAQRVARRCYVLMENDGTFYNFDDDVSRFNNKLLASCRIDIEKIMESYNTRHPIKDVLGF